MTVSNIAARAKGEHWRGASFSPRDAFAGYIQRFGHHWVETRTPPHERTIPGPPETHRRISGARRRGRPIHSDSGRGNRPSATNGHAIHMGAINVHEWISSQKGGAFLRS